MQQGDGEFYGVERVTGENYKIFPVSLALYELRANAQIHIHLDENSPAYWCDTIRGNRRVGVSVAAVLPGAILNVGRFIVNRKMISIYGDANGVGMRLRLYVCHSETRLSGSVDLPPGARMEVESMVDRVVCAQGSFTLNLHG